jgi:CubicO group peptidase (beta-lactamase class C family)
MVSQETIDGVLAEADDLLIAAVNEHTLPGLAVGIVHDGELVYAKGLGMADAKEERPVTPDTVFRIGSISKTFTAIGLMQLWEQGKFQLDDPVSGYLKTYTLEHRDPDAPPVTFRHLLTHTAGIGEFRTISDLARFRSTFALGVKEGEPVPALDEYYGGRLTPELHPGEKWAYANHGFATVGQLLEDISGETFEEYMMRHVLEPLGMFRTDYLRSDRVMAELATGYGSKKGLPTPVSYHEIAVRPAGSIFSSVNEMAMYMAALMNGGANQHGSVIKPDTLRMMMESHYRLDERLPAIGLAFWLDSIGGHRTAGHGGGWPGFVSAMHVVPDDGLGVIAFTNTNSLALDTIATDLLRRLLDVPEAAVQLPRPGILESPHLWHELCGSYGPKPGFLTNARVWMTFGGEAEVFVKDNHLAVRSLVGPAGKGLRLYPVDPADPLLFQTEFERIPVPAVFKRDEAGQIDRLCVGGLGFTTLYRRPKAESLRLRGTVALAGLAALLGAFGWRKLRRR